MKIHHRIDDLPEFHNAVITLGSFDGVHHGHVELVELMKVEAKDVGGETIVVTFDPHPRQIIYPADKELRLLSTKEEKIRLFGALEIDHLVFCPFTVEFSQISADEYITSFILDRFHPRLIVIGYDHRFGQNRSGNIDFLKSYEEKGGYEVIELAPQMTEKIRVSSTKIRNFLLEGKIEQANKFLGHPYLISGQVVRGSQIGEKIGYPTANIKVATSLKLVPPQGIYAVQTYVGSQAYQGMLYIGKRPSVTSDGKLSIEVNIFEFSDDIYGEEIFVELLKYMRDDMVFANLEQLSSQLDEDKRAVQAYLERYENSESVAVVILNYNGLHHLQNHLASVVRHSTAKIIVADNGSTDASVPWLKENHPEVELIELPTNYGFAEGYNQALQHVRADYIVLLNSDVEVTSQWLEPLLSFLKTNVHVAAVQPKIKSFEKKSTFEYAGAGGGLMDSLGYPFCQGRILSEVEEDQGQYDEAREVFWATGAAMALRHKVFTDFGGFDGSFFAHMEEIDLCWRMKQSGYQIWVIPSSVIYHQGGGTLSYTSPRKTYLNFRNGMSLLLKNEKGFKLLWLFPLRLALDLLAGVRFVIVGEWQNARAVMKAMLYTFRHFSSTWSKRRHILDNRAKLSVGKDNTDSGRYFGSIVWEFFLLGRKKYHDLKKVSSSKPIS